MHLLRDPILAVGLLDTCLFSTVPLQRQPGPRKRFFTPRGGWAGRSPALGARSTRGWLDAHRLHHPVLHLDDLHR